MSHTMDAAKTGLFYINALRAHRGNEPHTLESVHPNDIMDAITDLVHLAMNIDFEAAMEYYDGPHDLVERSVTAYEGDMSEDQGEDPEDKCPGIIALHGSPILFEKGEVLRPGAAYHHVFAVPVESASLAQGWAELKAAGWTQLEEHERVPHVYRVRMGEDAFHSSGHILSTTATVIEEATD